MLAIGIAFIVQGLFDLYRKNTTRGIINIAIGLVIAILGMTIVKVVLIVLGIYLVLKGLYDLCLNIKVNFTRGIVYAILTMLLGVILIAYYWIAVDWVFIIIGILFVLNGILGLINGVSK